MSKPNIKRTVQDGKIKVTIHRAEKLELDGSLADVRSFKVKDNGI